MRKLTKGEKGILLCFSSSVILFAKAGEAGMGRGQSEGCMLALTPTLWNSAGRSSLSSACALAAALQALRHPPLRFWSRLPYLPKE